MSNNNENNVLMGVIGCIGEQHYHNLDISLLTQDRNTIKQEPEKNKTNELDIIIKFMDRSDITLGVMYSTTIFDIKVMLHAIIGHDPIQQRILFRNKLILEQTTLLEINIKNGDIFNFTYALGPISHCQFNDPRS